MTDTAAVCTCESGPGSAGRRCGGRATSDDGLCDYCRENEWCTQWRAEQAKRHTDPEQFGMNGYCGGPWPCAQCDALGADRRTPYRGR